MFQSLSFPSVSKEIDALKLLQGVEFAASVRNITRTRIKCSFGAINDLINEFSFKRTCSTVNAGDVSSSSFDGDEAFLSCKDNLFFLKDFSNRLELPLGPQMQSNLYQSALIPYSTYTFDKHSKLGDAISIVIGFENYCRANNIDSIKLSGTKIFEDVIELFSLDHVHYAGLRVPKEGNINLDEIFKFCSWSCPWLKRFNYALCDAFGGRPSFSPHIPKLRKKTVVENRDVIYCQFDSRSSVIPPDISPLKLASIFCGNENVAAIGGRDTSKYLGNDFNYELGGLSEIASKLLGCRLFIGCDSGIGHLAGVLGVKGYILNFTDFDPVYSFFKDYSTITVVNRNILDLPLPCLNLSIHSSDTCFAKRIK